MQIIGEMYQCDRCDATEFFKHIAEDGTIGGGHSRIHKFQEAIGWSRKFILQYKPMDLCPKCTAEYQALKEQMEKSFMNIPEGK